ncbi:Uncharacterized protein PECH_002928 [Penicillium ucsense]|uniref:Protein transport protein sec16 n=1 Tax=Penicillium ucsense TaxID=2839758 RepID=A0A8J8W766_9EURO|nr:Uncharacterized protein PECM_003959 [Penicillium ucsense]KAF7737753.1 Uncharacterized protein PECH_002928 [Penicillium ucsense]
MAEQMSPVDDGRSWNPARRPEGNFPDHATDSDTVPLTAADPQSVYAPNVTSSDRDEEFAMSNSLQQGKHGKFPKAVDIASQAERTLVAQGSIPDIAGMNTAAAETPDAQTTEPEENKVPESHTGSSPMTDSMQPSPPPVSASQNVEATPFSDNTIEPPSAQDVDNDYGEEGQQSSTLQTIKSMEEVAMHDSANLEHAFNDLSAQPQPVRLETSTQNEPNVSRGQDETVFGGPKPEVDSWNEEEQTGLDSEGDDFFSQLKTQTKPIFAPPESESRFEEGVPLLEEDEARTPAPDGQFSKETADPFANEEDDADDFFSSSRKDELNEAPPSGIHRKSTTQVMKSAGMTITSPESDTEAAALFEDALKVSSSTATGEQNAVSAGPTEDELAARWEAELSDTGEDELVARWEAALDLDDDDILMENDSVSPALAGPQASVSQKQYVPQATNSYTSNASDPSTNATVGTHGAPNQFGPAQGHYTPHQPTTTDLVGHISFQGTPAAMATAAPQMFSRPPANPVLPRGESFAERSKEGYKSPYDLPEDLARPRRTLTTQKSAPVLVPPPMAVSQAGISPAAHSAPRPVAPPAQKNFYEELPLPVPKSRPVTNSGRYSPQPGVNPTSESVLASPPPQNPYAPTAPAATTQADIYPQPSLQLPHREEPYAGPALLGSSAPTGPPAASRYSPQPPGLQPSTRAPSVSRYSPAPPASGPAGRNRYASQPLAVPGHANNLPFQPRTSSPLAYHEKARYQPGDGQSHLPQPPSLQPSVDLSPPRNQRASFDQGSPHAPQLPSEHGGIVGSSSLHTNRQTSPIQNKYAPPEYLNEFAQRVAPGKGYGGHDTASILPPSQELSQQPSSPAPRRSQTSSPGQQLTSPRGSLQQILTLPRPASVHGSSSPTKTTNPYASLPTAVQHPARRYSQQLEFIAPTDGQEADPLQRWRGAPIFKFGFGGAVVSCFPKHIPRYSVGQASPMIKPTLGEPKLSKATEVIPSFDTIVQHPGPLKSKSKKKDAIVWLSSKIAAFENDIPQIYDRSHPDLHKRAEEKILLWKLVKLLVENDGSFEALTDSKGSLRQIFVPSLSGLEPDSTFVGDSRPLATFASISAPSQSDAAADPEWMGELRNLLLAGEREKAVWAAVDRRMWGHALILASTTDRSIWKQAVQEFVRREIKANGGDTESLAAVYEIFAGNIEESVDELVPPSARAGHQLISINDNRGAKKNALEGLDSWKDTIAMVLSNRSSEDQSALLALGRLLASYGRVEAAHICFLFSRSAIFGGADDPQANIVLLGADHQRHPGSLVDEDAILLTEVYEFATSVLGNSTAPTLPYLLAFKLIYARKLADRGRKTEAQAYCDGVASSLKSSTRPSPYHHQRLLVEVDELSARLRQTTTDGGSWISKPSMEKVSGSMWARFNSFVAGDEADAASTGPGKAGEVGDSGPFANVAGTPTVSRSPSVSDLYGSYPGVGAAQPAPISTSGPSKYMPTQYAPNASPEQFRGRSSIDSQMSPSFGGVPFGQRRTSQDHPSIPVESYAPVYGSPGANLAYQSTPPQSSYIPLAPVEEDMSSQPSTSAEAAAPPSQYTPNEIPYQPSGHFNQGQVKPPSHVASQSSYFQEAQEVPQPDGSAYMPPPGNSYAPPSYAGPDFSSTNETTEETTEENPRPEAQKKKSFMDDDDEDDLAVRAAAMQKAENDRKADEAFRKAAEEDAKKDAQQSSKKGWFGGWFGGAKKEAENTGGGPIKAKLGEENSFYYDKELKKWVNKKDPNSASAARATPPPPRGSGPPSRAASSSSVPPPGAPPMSGTGSRPQSSASNLTGPPPPSNLAPSALGVPLPPGNMPRSVSTGAAVPTPPGSSTGLPPRPASSLTNANSIDDLLGAPTARKGNAAKSKKKGRYVDVMAQ